MVWTARVAKGKAPLFLHEQVEPRKERKTQVLVTKAEMIFGVDHLRTALYHAKKAVAEGRNASDSLALETLLYASGERQLSSALKKMTVDDDTEEIVVAKLSEGAFKPHESWQPFPDKIESPSRDRLLRFGLAEKELATLGNRHPIELVMEKVAAVDVLKK
jgi:tRNA threonylcarbamoyladenosine modification (KEOPS) complex Cgi121 subunit